MSFLLFLRSNILRINKLLDVRFLQTEVLFLIDSLQDDTENEGAMPKQASITNGQV